MQIDPTRLQAVILTGIQACGKSTFYRERLSDTHVRINLDMLRTRHRERRFLATCLETSQSFVVDNTNLTKVDRARYIEPSKRAGFEVVGYYFQSKIGDALKRNGKRAGRARVPDAAIRSAHARLELPSPAEGFDLLFYVALIDGDFLIESWSHETERP